MNNEVNNIETTLSQELISIQSNWDIMPIPPLHSDYLPVGVYDCSFQELNNTFGTNICRKELMDKLDKYIQKLKQAGISGWIIVDGSFITSKTRPNDIDIILVRKRDDFLLKPVTEEENEILDEDRVKNEYKIHLIPTIEGDRATTAMTSFFSRVRDKGPDVKKGLVRLTI